MQMRDVSGQHIAHQRGATLAAALTALVGGANLAIDNSLFADGDTSWHIAAGRWILQHGAVPTRDPFSYSMPGTPWHAHEWLAEVPMALLFDAGDCTRTQHRSALSKNI